MKILITGGSGFIGSSLAADLRSRSGYEVLAPSRTELDVADESAVDRFMACHRPDIVVHTANRGGGRDTVGLEDVVHRNLRMFFNLAKHASRLTRIIHLGSGAEYGKHRPIVRVREEEASRSLPSDAYGFYKSVCSRYIERSENMVNLRIFACFGERENYRYKFITNAIVKNLLGLPITIHRNVRFDYLYIEDLLGMIRHFLHHDGTYRVYNATRGEGVELIQLAEQINRLSGRPVPIRILHGGMGNEYTSDNSRILSELENVSFTPHEEAIRKLFDFFRERLDTIDTKTVREDPFLRHCQTLWKVKNDDR
jgi:GDP-L-fucose synthase